MLAFCRRGSVENLGQLDILRQTSVFGIVAGQPVDNFSSFSCDVLNQGVCTASSFAKNCCSGISVFNRCDRNVSGFRIFCVCG